MKPGEVWYNISNNSIGIRVEEYNRKNKSCLIQHIDFVDEKPIRSFIFEDASENKIKKMYSKLNGRKS